jgi:uncharacterized protein (DUF1330 family)|tara:strand:+ start:2561 stop:3013 length:453 start_codon:yes stop_codon:yes gene_type:complete
MWQQILKKDMSYCVCSGKNKTKGFTCKAHCRSKELKKSNKRIHRKKGEPETSKKNTDLYVDRDKSDTVPISFKNRQAVKDTFNSSAFKNASHQRQSLVVGVIEQRARAAKKRAKDTKKKKDLAQAEDEAKKKRQQLKRKTKSRSRGVFTS